MIELACITDSAFARHTAAMLHSALSRSPGAAFTCHVLHEGPLAAAAVAGLRAVAEARGAALRLVEVPAALADPFPAGYFPRSVWLRVLLPELLPGPRVLYLDSDVVVTDRLQPLWETDLAGRWLGAVTNPFYPFMPDHPRLRLGIGRPQDYFNSGVLLMDLERMRRERTLAGCIEFARRHPGADYPDQDALNHVCRGHWLPLHPRWNVQSTLYDLAPRQLPLPPQQVAEALARPAVIHFIGPFKPWHYLCRHPRREAYFEHARATPWGAPALEGRSLRNAVLRRLPLAWIDRILRAERRAAGLWRATRAGAA